MKKDFLDKLNVKSPCRESWDEMTSGDRMRFCAHCARDVYDLSAMTRADAERLLKTSNGRICVRYVKTPQGKLVSAPPKLTPDLGRRARVAAGVLAASLALSTLAHAQKSEPVNTVENRAPTVEKTSETSETIEEFSMISGTVTDENGAVIAGIKVTLRNVAKQTVRHTRSRENGFYRFCEVTPGIYEIELEFKGSKKLVRRNLNIGKNTDIPLDLSPFLVEPEPVELDSGTMGIIIITEDWIAPTE